MKAFPLPSLSKPKWLLLPVIGILILNGIVLWQWWDDPKPVLNGGLVIDPSECNFGEVWETNAYVKTVTLRNPTSRDIAVENLRGG